MPRHLPPRETRGAGSNAALLIDFDNVTMGIRSDLQSQLHRLLDSDIIRGKVAVQRAYADWRRYPQYIVPLSEASIDLIFAPAFGSNKKNATDIRLAIDALELVFTRPEIGTFILLSGDSDFSSLVLKLREYGRYVIGVGIRESASDLLVQNCDEYYSYSELTGLTRTADIEVTRRDPWELVVEAIVRMQQHGDVMRSDRLKQVMQEIDPHFDEKDVGVNKFSRFVLEASHRGLLTLTKLDNGQFEVGVGPEANTMGAGRTSRPPRSKAPAAPRKRARRRSSSPTPEGGITLDEGLELLRQALQALGATGENAVESRAARERMQELTDRKDDPLFDTRRFHRFLRQAHDASVVDLAKAGRVYRVKLPAEGADGGEEPEVGRESDRASHPEKPSRPRRRGSVSVPRRSRQAGDGEPVTEEAPGGETTTTDPSTQPTLAEAGDHGVGEAPARRARFRTGARGRGRARTPATPESPGPESDDATERSAATGTESQNPAAPPVSPKTPEAGPSRRSLRGRSGARGRGAVRGPDPSGGTDAAVTVEGTTANASPADSGSRQVAEPKEKTTTPASRKRPAPSSGSAPQRSAPPPGTGAEGSGDAEEENGLLKRMTAALQRAVLGPED